MQTNDEMCVWEELIYNDFVNDEYDQPSKQFIIQICMNNFEYVKNNYGYFNDQDMRKKMFIIAITHSNLVSLVTFLIDVFEIDLSDEDSIEEIYDGNYQNFTMHDYIDVKLKDKKYYLHLACFYNSSLEIIKYLIKNMIGKE